MFNSLTCGGQSHSWTHFVRWLFQTVPAGHRHPGTQELLGHGTLISNLLSHVRWHEGTQSSNTDPPLQETPYNRENRHLMTVDCWPDAHMQEIKRCLLWGSKKRNEVKKERPAPGDYFSIRCSYYRDCSSKGGGSGYYSSLYQFRA